MVLFKIDGAAQWCLNSFRPKHETGFEENGNEYHEVCVLIASLINELLFTRKHQTSILHRKTRRFKSHRIFSPIETRSRRSLNVILLMNSYHLIKEAKRSFGKDLWWNNRIVLQRGQKYSRELMTRAQSAITACRKYRE